MKMKIVMYIIIQKKKIEINIINLIPIISQKEIQIGHACNVETLKVINTLFTHCDSWKFLC